MRVKFSPPLLLLLPISVPVWLFLLLYFFNFSFVSSHSLLATVQEPQMYRRVPL